MFGWLLQYDHDSPHQQRLILKSTFQRVGQAEKKKRFVSLNHIDDRCALQLYPCYNLLWFFICLTNGVVEGGVGRSGGTIQVINKGIFIQAVKCTADDLWHKRWMAKLKSLRKMYDNNFKCEDRKKTNPKGGGQAMLRYNVIVTRMILHYHGQRCKSF